MSEAWAVVAVDWTCNKIFDVVIVSDPRKRLATERRVVDKHYMEDELGREVNHVRAVSIRVEVPEGDKSLPVHKRSTNPFRNSGIYKEVRDDEA